MTNASLKTPSLRFTLGGDRPVCRMAMAPCTPTAGYWGRRLTRTRPSGSCGAPSTSGSTLIDTADAAQRTSRSSAAPPSVPGGLVITTKGGCCAPAEDWTVQGRPYIVLRAGVRRTSASRWR